MLRSGISPLLLGLAIAALAGCSSTRLVEGQVRLGEWKDKLLEDPACLMDAYLAAAQGQGQWSGAADERRRA